MWEPLNKLCSVGAPAVRFFSVVLTAAGWGALLAILGAFWAAHKVHLPGWAVPKFWFFFVLYVSVVGTVLELWVWRHASTRKSQNDDRRID